MIAIVVALAACGDDASSASDGGAPHDASVDAPPGADASIDVPSKPATWSPRAPLPAAQQETAVLALGGKIYVIGGFLGNSQPTNAVNVYDPAADTWTAAAPLPEPLHHVNAAVVDGKIWIVGALRSLAFNAAGLVIVFDPAANTWTPKPGAAMPAGSERGSSVVGAIGKVIYVAGGFRGGAVADFSSFDTETESWTPRPPLDAPRDHAMGGVVAGKLYAIGGRDGTIGGHYDRVDAFDPVTGAWMSRAPMPTSRGGGAAAVAKGLVIVAGGEGNGDSATGVFADVEAYDPATDAWSKLPPMLTPRHGTGAATVDDVVYVPGGGDRQAFGATAVVEAITF
ncbi:MAG: kelch repeat-containing protein [Labilithrix sp.]|nr:kelch repeat-containing protein [Labilithrix sp.]